MAAKKKKHYIPDVATGGCVLPPVISCEDNSLTIVHDDKICSVIGGDKVSIVESDIAFNITINGKVAASIPKSSCDGGGGTGKDGVSIVDVSVKTEVIE